MDFRLTFKKSERFFKLEWYTQSWISIFGNFVATAYPNPNSETHETWFSEMWVKWDVATVIHTIRSTKSYVPMRCPQICKCSTIKMDRPDIREVRIEAQNGIPHPSHVPHPSILDQIPPDTPERRKCTLPPISIRSDSPLLSSLSSSKGHWLSRGSNAAAAALTTTTRRRRSCLAV